MSAEEGTMTMSTIPERLGGVTEVVDDAPEKPDEAKPKRKRNTNKTTAAETKLDAPIDALDAPKAIPGAVVGLPVQYTDMGGNVIPGRLQRLSRTDISKWNVKVSIEGSSVEPVRFDVAFSETPKPNHWNFLPKQ